MGKTPENKINIRIAITDDLPAIERIEKDCFPDPWSAKTLRHDFLQGPGNFWVATNGTAVLGYANLWFVADEVQLIRIAVMSDQRKQGIGTQLLARAIAEANDRNARYVHLEVRESNTVALDLYQQAGFVVQTKREDAYSNPREDGYLLTRELEGTE